MLSAPTLFLSPHYDDVALSCGGTAALAAAAGRAPAILTVFAGELVDDMVGPFASWKHQRWGLDDVDAVQDTRRAEDLQAARILGCTLRWLGWPDAIYRGERYAGDGALYATPHAEEQALPAYLAEELRHLPEWDHNASVAVPLGIGRHVDHQLVFEAGAVLAAAGVQVWAYEDLPYAIHTPASLPQRLRQLAGRIGEEQRVPVEDSLETKLAAVASYATQLPVIFRFTDDFRAALREHARAIGGGRACERFWRVLPATITPA